MRLKISGGLSTRPTHKYSKILALIIINAHIDQGVKQAIFGKVNSTWKSNRILDELTNLSFPHRGKLILFCNCF
jgi:hypothetical protein